MVGRVGVLILLLSFGRMDWVEGHTSQDLLDTSPLTSSVVSLQGTTMPDGSSEVTATEDDSGSTLTIVQGRTLTVILHSTNWRFDSVGDPAVLRQLYEPVYAADSSGRIPGTGAGIPTVGFTAIGPGVAIIRVSRTSCGEALRCTGTQGEFSLIVNVISNGSSAATGCRTPTAAA